VVACPQACPFSWASTNHIDDQQSVSGRLEFHTEANKVAVDLVVEIIQLPAGQEGGVVVEATHRRCRKLHDRDSCWDAERSLGRFRDPVDHHLGIASVDDRPSSEDLGSLPTAEPDAFGRWRNSDKPEKRGIVEGCFHG
jgi:hypothetical protein